MNFKLEKRELSDLFNLPSIAKGKTIDVRVYDEPHPFIPEINPNYVFSMDEVRSMIIWIMGGIEKNLWVFGPTGSGKTSIVKEFCGRIGRPVYQVGCHSRTEFPEMVGQWVLQGDKGMSYIKGALPLAMQEGAVLLLNEYDQLNPSTAMGFNDVLDAGGTMLIKETGELVTPTDSFRIAATANSNGWGDPTGQYRGVQTQNVAGMDRWLLLEKGYMPEDQELEILAKSAHQLPVQLHKSMVAYANEVRKMSVAKDGGSLNVPFSTRSLLRWAKMTVALLNVKSNTSALDLGLEKTLFDRGEPQDQEALRGLWKRMSPFSATNGNPTP